MLQIDNIIFKHKQYGYCKAVLFIENGIIANIEIIDKSPIDFRQCEFYVTPGFINCHLHPNQLFDRGYLMVYLSPNYCIRCMGIIRKMMRMGTPKRYLY